MNWQLIHSVLVFFQHCVSVVGIIIILIGVVVSFSKYLYYIIAADIHVRSKRINEIRIYLGKTIILGLEFIVAADLIGSTTTPDYYSVGLLAIIVLIRTFLSFSINREITLLSREPKGTA